MKHKRVVGHAGFRFSSLENSLDGKLHGFEQIRFSRPIGTPNHGGAEKLALGSRKRHSMIGMFIATNSLTCDHAERLLVCKRPIILDAKIN